MEYLEDYHFTLHYHLGKANVVADALNWKSRGVFGLRYVDQAKVTLGNLVATPSLMSRVIESQGQDTNILSIRDWV